MRINAYKEQNYALKSIKARIKSRIRRIKMLEDEMSRMGDWVIEMQEDCIYMDRGPWIEKYGTRFAYIYDEQLRVVAPVACIYKEHLGIIPDKPLNSLRSYEKNE